MEPIAIVGLSFKLPQEARSESSLWDVLEKRKNLMTEWPANRLNVEGFYQAGTKKSSTLIGRGAHFIDKDPSRFDAPFFGITAKEANAMDPEQRWILETCYHAFENAGITIESLKNSRMAVFEGSTSDEYTRMHSKDPDNLPTTTATGSGLCIRPNRVSWHFGLVGPSIHVDTACSSSLVALDLACQSIRAGDASSALVVGCNLMLGPELSLGLGNQGFLSPSSLCYSFDHRADGYGRGEGIVAIVIKPLADAIAAGDTIRALIRATGSNSDGRTGSLTQPSAEAQASLIRHVYAKADLDTQHTRYFEAHGTGTPTGDPIEMKAIGKVFRKSRAPKEPLYVGSIKSNIGHVEGAAGLAGVLKAILVLEKGIIPPNALFEKLNPNIDAEFFNIQVPVHSIPWPSSGIRRVSVNSFGMGGANSHVVLDDALSYLERHRLDGIHRCTPNPVNESFSLYPSHTPNNLGNDSLTSVPHDDSDSPGQVSPDESLSQVMEKSESLTSAEEDHGLRPLPKLLIWTANDEDGIARVAKNLEEYFNSAPELLVKHLDRIAYTLSERRSHLTWRSFAVVDIPSSMNLVSLAAKPVRASMAKKDIAFVFTGQGAQYAQMGMELIHYPAFMDTLDQIDAIFRSIGCQWSLLEEMISQKNINLPEYSQPLCTALQIALVKLLQDFRITPTAVVGHSSGEIAAAYAVGALSMEMACKVAFYRGLSAARLRSLINSTSGAGAMMSVNLSSDECQQYLRTFKHDDPEQESSSQVHIACINSPVNCTISGDEKVIDQLKERFDKDGIFAQKFETGGVAYHSPAMQLVASDYLHSLIPCFRDISPVPMEAVPFQHTACMVSSVTGKLIHSSELCNPQYWVDNLVSPVKFLEAMLAMITTNAKSEFSGSLSVGNGEISDIVEVGPHSALRRPIKEILGGQNKGAPQASGNRKKDIYYHCVLSRNKPPMMTTLELVGNLFSRGHSVSMMAVNRRNIGCERFHALMDLPQYPFDHSHIFWQESKRSVQFRFRPPIREAGDASAALLGMPAQDFTPLQPRWRALLSREAYPWIGNHIINGTNLLAGTCMLTMAIQAAKRTFESTDTSSNKRISGFLIRESRNINFVIVGETVGDAPEMITQLRELHRNGLEKGSRLYEILLFSCNKDGRWSECFECTVQVEVERHGITDVDGGLEKSIETERLQTLHQNARSTCDKPLDSGKLYEYLHNIADVTYRDEFAVLERIHWDGNNSSLATINLWDASKRRPIAGVLDAAVHLVSASSSQGLSKRTASANVLSGISDTWISARLFEETSKDYPAELHILTAITTPAGRSSGTLCRVSGLDETGAVLVSMRRVDMTPVATTQDDQSSMSRDSMKKLLYSIEWMPQLSLMTSPQLQNYLSTVPGNADIEDFMIEYYPKINSAMTQVAQNILAEFQPVTQQNLSLPTHLKKLLATLRHFYGERETQKDQLKAQLDTNPKPTSTELGTIEDILRQCEEEKPSWKLFCVMARNLSSIIRGDVDPLELFFSDGLADAFYVSLFESTFTPRLQKLLELASHENPGLRILEVGAGTGGMTRQVLSTFKNLEACKGTVCFSNYTYTDVSAAFFINAKATFGEFEDRMTYKTLDLESDEYEAEGLEPESYDIILAGSVLHATSDLHKTLTNLRRLLKCGGFLVFVEITSPESACGNIGFGTLPGWWLSSEEWRPYSPLINERQWDTLLKQADFSGTYATLRDYESDVCHFSSIVVSKKVPKEDEEVVSRFILPPEAFELAPQCSVSEPKNLRIVVVIDEEMSNQVDLSNLLRAKSGCDDDHFQVFSWHNELKKGDNSPLMIAAHDPDAVVVFLLEINQPFLARLDQESFRSLKTLTLALHNLLWISSCSKSDPEFPFYGATSGYLRVMRGEHTDKYIVSLQNYLEHNQLSSLPQLSDANDLVNHIWTVLTESFSSTPGELEYVIQNGVLGIWRLREECELSTKAQRLILPTPRREPWASGPPLELSIETPGVLDSFRFIEDKVNFPESDIGPFEVEIQAKAWPLSFRDLLLALGRMDYHTPGLECAGVITRLGSSVGLESSADSMKPSLKVGDRVCLAMIDSGSMRMYPRGSSISAFKIPDNMTYEAAVSAINPAMTAYHSLVNLARLKATEKVLIHSAAGATGQMALWIAKMIGAEIFATVGTDEKKHLLVKQFEIPEDHIFYSRDITFAQGVKRMTGSGVDVVLNSLSGDALRASWECVAPYGRFIEIGKADIMSNTSLPMSQFARNTSFFAVDLYDMALTNPDVYQSILANVLELLDRGVIHHPKPLHCYSMTDVEGAFRFMQSGKNTGRILLTAADDDVVDKMIRDKDSCKFDPAASYLIIGGLGGLGRAIMKWMADKGARNLITVSRSGLSKSSKAAFETVMQLRNQGVCVYNAQCDASSAESLQASLQEASRTMPPIKGCINSSMDIYDTPFESMSFEQWQSSLKSKVDTSWCLHKQFPIGSLDFFILLSSLAGVFGTLAQSNYATGCTFQDAVAEFRTMLGDTNSVCLDVGWMRSVGKVAETEEYQRNREYSQDMQMVETEELLSLLSIYCQANTSKRQILLGAVTPAKFLDRGEAPPPLLQRPMFCGFVQEASTNKFQSEGNTENLATHFRRTTDSLERVDIVVNAVVARLARALGVSVDNIEPSKILGDYGVDSLMAVELRNWIGKEFKANVPVFDILGGITILTLGGIVVEKAEI